MVLTRRRDDAGAVAILVAVFAIVVFVFAAIIVDLGLARATRRDAQNAADAAALAAANALYPGGGVTPDFPGAVSAAKSYAAANAGTTDADWTGCTTTDTFAHRPAGTPCISFDSATDPTNVRVVIPTRRVSSFFGGVVGYQGMDVTALAQAQVARQTRPQCAFCVLGPLTHQLQNGQVTMANGDVWFNGNLELGPHGSVQAPDGTVHVQGTVDPRTQVSSPLVSPSSAVADPLSDLAVPPSDLVTSTPRLDPCADGPGFYGAVNLTGNGTCTLAAGLYVFTEPLSVGGNHTLVGTGVTLYFACGVNGVRSPCSSDTNPGRLNAGGGGGVQLSAPTSGPRKGLVIVYDRSNTAALSIQGNMSTGTVTGTIYAPDASLDIRGNGCGTTFASMVVIHGLSFSGNPSCFTSTYNAAANVDLLPLVAGLVR